MCTSSSTTSGVAAAISCDRLGDRRGVADDVDEPVELGAHAGAKQLVVVDEHDARHRGHRTAPARLGEHAARPRCRRRARRWIVGAPAVALHAPDDRLAHAAAVGRHGGGVEARPAVADEDLQALVAGLGVDGDRAAAAELRGVEHRLARGGDQRLAVAIELRVADGDDVDRARRARSSISCAAASSARGQAGARRPRARAHPTATCAARAPGGARARRPRAGRRRASAPARASAAPSRAGARRPRRAPASGSAPARSADSDRTRRTIHGAKITPKAIATTSAASDDVGRGGERAAELQEDDAAAITSVTPIPMREMTAGRDSPAAGAQHRRRGRAARSARAAARFGDRVGAAGRAVPDQRAAGGDEHERPDQQVGERQPERAEGEQDGEQQEAGAERDLDRAAPAPAAASARAPSVARALLGGQQDPRQHVGDEADAAGERRRGEHDPQQQRIDAASRGRGRRRRRRPCALSRSRRRSRARGCVVS